MNGIEKAVNVAEVLYKLYSKIFESPDKFNSEILLMHVIKYENIYLEGYPFKNDLCGMLLIEEEETTLVYNINQPRERRNFTIGHELGHFFLHKGKSDQFADRSKSITDNAIEKFEMQANAFSAYLIMPEEVILYFLNEFLNFFQIKRKLNVSKEALYWRLVNLLINKYAFNSSRAQVIVEQFIKCSIDSINNISHHKAAYIYYVITNKIHHSLVRMP